MKHASKTDHGMKERGPSFVGRVMCAALFKRSSLFESLLIEKRVDWMYLFKVSYAIVSRETSAILLVGATGADIVCRAAYWHHCNPSLPNVIYCSLPRLLASGLS